MPLRAEPASAAILTDVDGTLAPIVARAELARIPGPAQAALANLARRYGLVACISGRRALDARRLVGLPQLTYSGNHGLELLRPGETQPVFDPALEDPERAADFVAELDAAGLAASGLRLEDKGPIQALHWRGAVDEGAAEARARAIAAEARAFGLHPHWGKKVLELRPSEEVGKDVAVSVLLRPNALRAAVYAGDDRTDLDAFRRLRELRRSGELETGVCVGVASPEAPPELAREADLTVDGPSGWLAVLAELGG